MGPGRRSPQIQSSVPIGGARDEEEILDLKVSTVLEEGCHAPRLCPLQTPGPRTARHANRRCHLRGVGPRFIQLVRLLTRLAKGHRHGGAG